MKSFPLLWLLLFPSLVWAGDTSLNPPTSDVSVTYLGTIFGVVDEVLHGTGSQILGNMFGVFNSVVLILASLLWMGAAFIGTINTASEGEFLGRKWSSIWVPLRIVSGTALLYPKATGYSFIQILVMYIVVQGVGAADKVWNVALDYLQRDGTLVEKVQSVTGASGGPNNSFLINKAGNILKSEVCMMTLYNALQNQNGSSVPTNFMNSIEVTGKDSNGADTGKPINYKLPKDGGDSGGYIQFPGAFKENPFYNKYRGACGYVSWNFVQNDSGKVANPAELTANDSTSIGVRQMVLNLQTVAETIANKLAPPRSSGNKRATNPKLDPTDIVLFPPGALLNTASDYYAIIKPALRQLRNEVGQDKKSFLNDAKQSGWIMAGAYYYRLALLNQSIRKVSDLEVSPDNITANFQPDYYHGPFKDISDENVIHNLEYYLPHTGGIIDKYVKLEYNSSNDPNANKYLFPSSSDASGAPNVKDGDPPWWNISNQMITLFTEEQEAFERQVQTALDQDFDPMLALINIGTSMLKQAEGLFFGLIAIVLLVGGIAAVGAMAASFFVPALPIVSTMFLSLIAALFAPLFFTWIALKFSMGVTLAYYIPMIPFLLFMFGAITWFAVVIEAMIAAPLVALGITHPDGHDFLGKAEQAIMLLASVLLRPVLMVFGFIFGVILSFVTVSLFNHGFSLATQFVKGASYGWIIGCITDVAMFLIYTSSVVTIISRSFAMIYEVPNKVLRWIGGQPDSTFEESALQQVRGGIDRGVEQVASAARTSGDQIVDVGRNVPSLIVGHKSPSRKVGVEQKGTPIGN